MYLCALCSFISLVKIAIDQKPFSKVLTCCIWIIGGMVTAASIVFPRLEGYQSSGFELFSGFKIFSFLGGSRVLIDGAILLPGLLLITLGFLIKAGFELQRDMDEIM